MVYSNLAAGCLLILLLSTQSYISQAQKQFLLFANRPLVRRLNLNNSSVSNIADTTGSSFVGLDYDIRSGDVFWSDTFNDKIVKADFTGLVSRTFSIDGDEPSTIESIAWDWVNRKLYWADSERRTLEVLDPATQNHKVLHRFEDTTPRIIVLDPIRRWMYWSAWGVGNQNDGQIVRMSMDGSSDTSTVLANNRQVVWPNGLTLDLESQTLYWVDALKDTISKSRTDGSNLETILDLNSTSLGLNWHTFGVDYFNDDLYFGNWFNDSLFTINVNSPSSTLKRVIGTMHDTGTVRVVDPTKQPAAPNPCEVNNGGCSYLCLLSATSPNGYSCVCPDDVDPEDCVAEVRPPTEATAAPNTGDSFTVSGTVFLSVVGSIVLVIVILTLLIAGIVIISIKTKYSSSRKRKRHSMSGLSDNSPRDSPPHFVVGRINDHDYISIQSRDSPAPRSGIVISIENLRSTTPNHNQYTIHNTSSNASTLVKQNDTHQRSSLEIMQLRNKKESELSSNLRLESDVESDYDITTHHIPNNSDREISVDNTTMEPRPIAMQEV